MRRAEYCQGGGRLWVNGTRLLFVSTGNHPAVARLEAAARGERPGRAVAAVVIDASRSSSAKLSTPRDCGPPSRHAKPNEPATATTATRSRSCWQCQTAAPDARQAPPGSSWPCVTSRRASTGPAPRRTRHGSRPCSRTRSSRCLPHQVLRAINRATNTRRTVQSTAHNGTRRVLEGSLASRARWPSSEPCLVGVGVDSPPPPAIRDRSAMMVSSSSDSHAAGCCRSSPSRAGSMSIVSSPSAGT